MACIPKLLFQAIQDFLRLLHALCRIEPPIEFGFFDHLLYGAGLRNGPVFS